MSKVQFKVNTGGLLKEILNNPGTAVLAKPLTIFANILAEVGTEAARINDPKLNKLMCRLAIYAETDPYNEFFDQKIVDKIMNG